MTTTISKPNYASLEELHNEYLSWLAHQGLAPGTQKVYATASRSFGNFMADKEKSRWDFECKSVLQQWIDNLAERMPAKPLAKTSRHYLVAAEPRVVRYLDFLTESGYLHVAEKEQILVHLKTSLEQLKQKDEIAIETSLSRIMTDIRFLRATTTSKLSREVSKLFETYREGRLDPQDYSFVCGVFMFYLAVHYKLSHKKVCSLTWGDLCAQLEINQSDIESLPNPRLKKIPYGFQAAISLLSKTTGHDSSDLIINQGKTSVPVSTVPFLIKHALIRSGVLSNSRGGAERSLEHMVFEYKVRLIYQPFKLKTQRRYMKAVDGFQSWFLGHHDLSKAHDLFSLIQCWLEKLVRDDLRDSSVNTNPRKIPRIIVLRASIYNFIRYLLEIRVITHEEKSLLHRQLLRYCFLVEKRQDPPRLPAFELVSPSMEAFDLTQKEIDQKLKTISERMDYLKDIDNSQLGRDHQARLYVQKALTFLIVAYTGFPIAKLEGVRWNELPLLLGVSDETIRSFPNPLCSEVPKTLQVALSLQRDLMFCGKDSSFVIEGKGKPSSWQAMRYQTRKLIQTVPSTSSPLPPQKRTNPQRYTELVEQVTLTNLII